MLEARMAERAKRLKNPRRRRNTYPSHSHRSNQVHGVITRKSDLKPDERYTIWEQLGSGSYVIFRSYPGRYIRDAMWDDIKAFNKANTRQYVVVGHGIDPNTGYRENLKSESGRKILTEAAVIGTAMVGDKLMKKGKVSPEVMAFIQARVEKELGRKPTKSEVKKALKSIDPNQDETLTAKEVTKALKRGKG